MNTLTGKGAIVTGAAQGLGYAIAKAYIDAGMYVVLMDVQADALAATAAAFGARALPITVDLSDAVATQNALAQALTLIGTPRILVHNAAVLVNRPLLAVTLDAWTREMNIIIQAAFILTQGVWQAMCDAGGGSIVYVSSRSGVEGFLDEAPYVAGKHALEGFMKCMAMEGAPHNILVNTITPGKAMQTPMSDYNYSEELKKTWVDPLLLTPAFLTLADDHTLSGQRLNAWEMRNP